MVLPKLHFKNTDLRHVNGATGTNSQKSMTRINKKQILLFCPLDQPVPGFYIPELCRGLLIPMLNSLDHFVLFVLNTTPAVHRPGILGATSQHLCLRCRAARSPTAKAYALSGSLPIQTLHAHCFAITLSCILALLWTAKTCTLICFIHFINMLSSQHRATEPSAPESLHSTFSPLITTVKLAQPQQIHSQFSSTI